MSKPLSDLWKCSSRMCPREWAERMYRGGYASELKGKCYLELAEYLNKGALNYALWELEALSCFERMEQADASK